MLKISKNTMEKMENARIADILCDAKTLTWDNEEEAVEYIQARIFEQEIVYYSVAIDFLQEHDQSLQESIELAVELGYTISDINSELLATLLLQNMMQTELCSVEFEEEEEEN